MTDRKNCLGGTLSVTLHKYQITLPNLLAVNRATGPVQIDLLI
jgi:hypothetical protein